MSHLGGAQSAPWLLAGTPGFMVEGRAMRPIRVRIDSAALRHNLGAARRRAPRSRICAVVKANAYGHGLARAARAFAAAEGLALIELEAALELRRAGERRPMDRKSTRLNSSHGYISYAVFCLKKKKKERTRDRYAHDETT